MNHPWINSIKFSLEAPLEISYFHVNKEIIPKCNATPGESNQIGKYMVLLEKENVELALSSNDCNLQDPDICLRKQSSIFSGKSIKYIKGNDITQDEQESIFDKVLEQVQKHKKKKRIDGTNEAKSSNNLRDKSEGKIRSKQIKVDLDKPATGRDNNRELQADQSTKNPKLQFNEKKVTSSTAKICREPTRNNTDKSKEEIKQPNKLGNFKLNLDFLNEKNEQENAGATKKNRQPHIENLNESMVKIRAKAKKQNKQRLIHNQSNLDATQDNYDNYDESRLYQIQMEQSNFIECTEMHSFSLDILENATVELEMQRQKESQTRKSVIHKIFDLINPFQCSK